MQIVILVRRLVWQFHSKAKKNAHTTKPNDRIERRIATENQLDRCFNTIYFTKHLLKLIFRDSFFMIIFF